MRPSNTSFIFGKCVPKWDFPDRTVAGIRDGIPEVSQDGIPEGIRCGIPVILFQNAILCLVNFIWGHMWI